MNDIQRQAGIGLVELMVAMTIALFLTLGLATAFYSMSLTAKNVQGSPGSTNQGLSGLQDSERMSMVFLGNSIQEAGFFNYPVANLVPPSVILSSSFPASAPFTQSGQSIFGTSGAVAGTDTLTVRFYGNGISGQGCSGQAVSGTIYTDTFSIVGNTLACTENNQTYSLVSGVSGMTILYGIGSAASAPTTGPVAGLSSVNQYLPANSVTNWTQVKTVQITLTFTNPLSGQSGQPATVTFARTFGVMNGI